MTKENVTSSSNVKKVLQENILKCLGDDTNKHDGICIFSCNMKIIFFQKFYK